MKREWLHNTKISENVGVRSFRKLETSEFRSFPEMENIGNFRSFRKSNNKQIHIPRKLTGVPGCVRTVERILTVVPNHPSSSLIVSRHPYLSLVIPISSLFVTTSSLPLVTAHQANPSHPASPTQKQISETTVGIPLFTLPPSLLVDAVVPLLSMFISTYLCWSAPCFCHHLCWLPLYLYILFHWSLPC